jgi:RNA polymerase sigma-70 factor, ECF subfamily
MATSAVGTFELGGFPPPALQSTVAERARPISELDDIDGLVRTYRAKLLRFVAYSTGDPDLAESIVQDTFLKAYNGRESFRGDSSVGTWLTSIAIHVMRDHQRGQRFKFWKKVKTTAIDVNEMASFIPAMGSSPERQLLAKEKVKVLSQVLEKLSQNQRKIFLMRFSEEMPVADISAALGMPVNTVRTHLQRALTSVRGQLGATI